MSTALSFQPALSRMDLLAEPVAAALRGWAGAEEVEVAEIDPALADTAAFCARYGVSLTESANCVVVLGRRGEVSTYAACVVAATTRADVNGLVRRHLDAKKASFAPVEAVTAASDMEYGGITPVGLPADWPVLVDEAVAKTPFGGDRLRYPRLQAQAPRAPARRVPVGSGAARPGRSGGVTRAELTLSVPDGILSEVVNRTPRSVRRLHGHRPLIPTVERRSGSGHLSPAQGLRPSGWR